MKSFAPFSRVVPLVLLCSAAVTPAPSALAGGVLTDLTVVGTMHPTSRPNLAAGKPLQIQLAGSAARCSVVVWVTGGVDFATTMYQATLDLPTGTPVSLAYNMPPFRKKGDLSPGKVVSQGYKVTVPERDFLPDEVEPPWYTADEFEALAGRETAAADARGSLSEP